MLVFDFLSAVPNRVISNQLMQRSGGPRQGEDLLVPCVDMQKVLDFGNSFVEAVHEMGRDRAYVGTKFFSSLDEL